MAITPNPLGTVLLRPESSSTNTAATHSPQQQQRVDEISAHLKQLSAAYHAEKSYFSRVAAWYSTYSWWAQLGLGLATTVSGALIGLLFSPLLLIAPLVSASAALGLYLLSAAVLTQHHRSDEKHRGLLLMEITNMEQILREAVSYFQAINAPIHQVLSALEIKSVEQEEGLEAFKTTTAALETQVVESGGSLHEINVNQTLLTHSNQALEQVIRDTGHVHTGFMQNQSELTYINQSLTQTQITLQQGVNALGQFATDVARSTSALQVLDLQLAQLENCVNESHATLERYEPLLTHELQAPILYEETPEEQEETSAQLQERALRNLSGFLAEIASTSEPQPVIRHRRSKDHFFVSIDDNATSPDTSIITAVPTKGIHS